jgi:DNA-binding CsgD family transcriptional regulator
MSALQEVLRELDADVTQGLSDLRMPALLLDNHGVVRWQNEAGLERYGDHTGEPLETIAEPAARADLNARLAAHMRSGQADEYTTVLALRDGQSEPVDVSAVPLRAGGCVVGVFGFGKPRVRALPDTKASRSQLTRRQREVLALLADGKSTDAIAAELGISTTTVRNHIANLMSVLGAHTRLEAVITATRAGLIDANGHPDARPGAEPGR